MKTCFSILILTLFSLNAHAVTHKWIDSEGKVHYSDTRPDEDIDTEGVRNVTGKGQVDAPASFTPKSIGEREVEMKKAKQAKEEAEQKQAQKDAEVETKKSNCASARENVRILEESPRITTYDANGEQSFMDDSTRAQRMEDARKMISSSCN